MKVKKVFPLSLLIISFFIDNAVFAQNPLVKQWDMRFGAANYETLTCIKQTSDGGYIIGGFSQSGAGGDKSGGNKDMSQNTTDYWVVKTDASGVRQWDKDFGGTRGDDLTSLQQTRDGGYILGGYSYSGISGDKTKPNRDATSQTADYWIIKIDSAGAYQWDADFGGLQQDILNSVRQTRDGGYILGGYSLSDSSGDKTQHSRGKEDYWIVKTDSAGNKQWDKRYGGTGTDYGQSVQQTKDGGYVVGGYSYSSGVGGASGTDKSQANWDATLNTPDYWIVKTDSVGNLEWDKRFGGGGYEALGALQQTADGGYILGGISNSGVAGVSGAVGSKTKPLKGILYDYWIVKINANGIQQWDQDFGGNYSQDEFHTICQTGDGGYLMAGTSYSPISGDKTESNLGPEQTWVIKTDANGNKKWDKTLHTNGAYDDETGLAIQSADGCYVMANYTVAGSGGDKTQASRGNTDYWIIKWCDTSTVSVLPPAANLLASDTVFCANACINFTDLSSGATSWQWSFEGAIDSTSAAQNPLNICYQKAGTYNVTLIASNAGGRDSVTFNNYIKVKAAPPTPLITQHHDTLYCSTNPVYTSYQWYKDSSQINGATDTLLVFTSSGNYNIKVTNNNGCRIAVGITVVGIKEFSQNNYLSLFPNPATNKLLISGNWQSAIGKLAIFNVLGQETSSPAPLQRRGESAVVDISSLAAGIYFVQIITERERWVGRFVKE